MLVFNSLTPPLGPLARATLLLEQPLPTVLQHLAPSLRLFPHPPGTVAFTRAVVAGPTALSPFDCALPRPVSRLLRFAPIARGALPRLLRGPQPFLLAPPFGLFRASTVFSRPFRRASPLGGVVLLRPPAQFTLLALALLAVFAPIAIAAPFPVAPTLAIPPLALALPIAPPPLALLGPLGFQH